MVVCDIRYVYLENFEIYSIHPRFKVPVPITHKRAQFLSMKWLIEAAKEKERTLHFPETLANELIAASNNGGKAVKRKQELHKQCEANRAYAHYRWS